MGTRYGVIIRWANLGAIYQLLSLMIVTKIRKTLKAIYKNFGFLLVEPCFKNHIKRQGHFGSA
jgi:hypothetical protein